MEGDDDTVCMFYDAHIILFAIWRAAWVEYMLNRHMLKWLSKNVKTLCGNVVWL